MCRFCTSHPVRVKKELLYRLHANRKKRTPKPPTTKQNQATKPTPQGDKGEQLLRNSHGHVGMVKSSETGAVNSARRSVDLVLQQIHVPLSTSTHDLVQAEGDSRDLPQLAIRTVSFRSSAPLKSTRQALMRISGWWYGRYMQGPINHSKTGETK